MNNKFRALVQLIITIVLIVVSLITFKNNFLNYSILFISLTLISLVYSLYLLMKKNDKKSVYDRNIKRIKKIYNSKLEKIEEDYEFDNSNFVNAKNIEDLFELADEFKQPIVYLEEDNGIIFFLQYGEDILYYVIKKDDSIETKFEKEIMNKNLIKNNSEKDMLSKINKTTIIQMKNNKFYKIKPIKK